MIKYVSHAITFQEVPDEVCLTIQISNCPHRCEGCHSPYLQEDVGEDLLKDLPSLLEQYKDRITCVCFMGTGLDMDALIEAIRIANEAGVKTAVYTGFGLLIFFKLIEEAMFRQTYYCNINVYDLDYIKTGEYIEALGPLSSKTTNQRMYKLIDRCWTDITYKFWKEKQ